MIFLKKKTKSKSKKRLFKFSIKVTVLLLSITLNASGLLSVSQTAAVYLDVETSSNNLLSAGSIDFGLSSSSYATSTKVNFQPGALISNEVIMDDFSSLPFQYFVTSDNFSGDNDFCNSLQANALLNGESFFSGDLAFLETQATTTISNWLFQTIFPSEDEFENKHCIFDLTYSGWQTVYVPSFNDGGFNDREVVSNRIDSWGIRVNKVYYDVALNKGEEVANEWVEIYNQTNKDIDISDWLICDNTSCDDLVGADLVPAQGFMIISASSTTWGHWEIPDDFSKFVISDETIGDGLDNNAEMLFLKRGDGFIVDQMNWGIPENSWANYNTELWNPGAVDVAEGSTLGRNPNGFDTNTFEDWHELIPPTVDLINPDQSGTLTWYWTYNYDITWRAINLNGDDSDLSVDIFFIRDIDQNGEISIGDTIHVIAENTENDGIENWTVPSGFLGYIWVKVIVSGAENPMLNNSMVSGKIWDPFPLALWQADPEGVANALLDSKDKGEVIKENLIVEEILIDGEVLGEFIEEELIEEVNQDIQGNKQIKPAMAGGGGAELPEDFLDKEGIELDQENSQGKVIIKEIELKDGVIEVVLKGGVPEEETIPEPEVALLHEEDVLIEDGELLMTEELIENSEEEIILAKEEVQDLIESVEKKEENYEGIEDITEEEDDEPKKDELPIIEEGELVEEIEEEIEIILETIEKDIEEVDDGKIEIEEIVEEEPVIEEVAEEVPVIEYQEPVPESATEELPVVNIEEPIIE